MDYKRIGDGLSIGEYNAYVSLIRNNMILSENFLIDKSIIIGKYGIYSFNFDDATIIEKGILITDETKSADNIIELIEPSFKHSTYHMKFQLMRITDYNLFVDNAGGYIETDTLEVELSADDDMVELDLSEYENNMILMFNVNVKITHDIPTISEV